MEGEDDDDDLEESEEASAKAEVNINVISESTSSSPEEAIPESKSSSSFEEVISESKSSSSEEVVTPQKEPPIFSKPQPVSPGKPDTQNSRKAEKEMIAWVKTGSKVTDVQLTKYAHYLFKNEIAVVDVGGDPEKVSLTPKGEPKFLHFTDKEVGSGITRRERFNELKERIWTLLKDPSVQAKYIGTAGGGKKEKARLHSESSPGGTQSQSKNQRVGSSPKL